MVRTSLSSAGGTGLIPPRVAVVPHVLWPKNQNINQKQYCNKLNKDFKKIEIEGKNMCITPIHLNLSSMKAGNEFSYHHNNPSI